MYNRENIPRCYRGGRICYIFYISPIARVNSLVVAYASSEIEGSRLQSRWYPSAMITMEAGCARVCVCARACMCVFLQGRIFFH